jgi:hypothetical protein
MMRDAWAYYQRIVSDLVSAGVALKNVDGILIAQCAENLLLASRHADTPSARVKFSSLATAQLEKLGGTPGGRQRLGVRTAKKKLGVLAQIQAERDGSSA